MDINKNSELDIPNEKRFSKVPLFTYFISCMVLKFLSTFQGDHILMKLIGYISSYITCVLLLIMVLDFFRAILVQSQSIITDGRSKTILNAEKISSLYIKILSKLKKNSKIPMDTSGCEQDKLIVVEDESSSETKPLAEQFTNCDEDGLYSISHTNYTNNTKEIISINATKYDSVLGTVYFILQLLLATVFFTNATKTPYIYLLEQESYSFLHVVVMLLVGCAFFLTNKWFLQAKDAKANKTVASYSLVFAIVCLIFAITLVLNIMFGMATATLLLWLCKITLMYLCIATVVCLILSAVKKELVTNYNYSIIPFMGKEYISTSVFDVLKENTGISLKSLWSLRYIANILPSVLLGFILLLFVSTSLYVVNPHQKGAVYSFGKLDENSIVGEGIHFKLPWPMEKAEIYDVSRTKKLQIGYESSDTTDFLWSKTHDGGEYYLLLGNGNELVCVNIKIIYTISDLYSYLTKTAYPEELLSSKAYEIMMERTVTTTLDKLLSIDRSTLSKSVSDELMLYSQEINLGINVSDVIIESIHPPVEIVEVYQNVVNAHIAKSTRISNAESSSFRTITDAQLESRKQVIEAKANQTKRVSDANYEMAVYMAAFEAYNINPYSFKLDKYLNTYQKIIGNNKVYVFSPNMDLDLSNYIINNSSQDNLVIANK